MYNISYCIKVQFLVTNLYYNKLLRLKVNIMTGMNLLEKQARYSIAISILNKVRHCLLERIPIESVSKELDVIKESFELSKGENQSRALIYSLQGFSDKEKAVSVQIAEIFNFVLKNSYRNTGQQKEQYEKFKIFFNNFHCQKDENKYLDTAIDLVTKSIHFISGETENQGTGLIKFKGL